MKALPVHGMVQITGGADLPSFTEIIEAFERARDQGTVPPDSQVSYVSVVYSAEASPWKVDISWQAKPRTT